MIARSGLPLETEHISEGMMWRCCGDEVVATSCLNRNSQLKHFSTSTVHCMPLHALHGMHREWAFCYFCFMIISIADTRLVRKELAKLCSSLSSLRVKGDESGPWPSIITEVTHRQEGQQPAGMFCFYSALHFSKFLGFQMEFQEL